MIMFKIFTKILPTQNKTIIFVSNAIIIVLEMADLNRIKIALVEKKKTSKWLAEQLGKNPATVSKWCTNTSQPDLKTLAKIAELLNMDIRKLINKL